MSFTPSVYLAGPISGCNENQRRVWRDELRTLLGDAFAYLDPVQWGGEWSPDRELLALESAAIVVANMWRESIGTSVGILHARALGKPVVLIDPNFLESRLLRELVRPEKPVRSVTEAAVAVKRIVDAFEPNVMVQQRNGALERFDHRKLTTSIHEACSGAGAGSSAIEATLVARVIEMVRQRPRADFIESKHIEAIVMKAIDALAGSPLHAPETRSVAERIREAWKRRGDRREAEEILNSAEEDLREVDDVKRENENLKAQLANAEQELARAKRAERELETLRRVIDDRGGLDAIVPECARGCESWWKNKSVEEAVRLAVAVHGDCLVPTEKTWCGSKASPYEDTHRVFDALEALARYARTCQATAPGAAVIGLKQYFESVAASGRRIDYVAKESPETMGQFGDERRVLHEGRTIEMQRHLRLGKKSANHCARIYFEKHDGGRKILLGHVGRHLTNCKTN